MKPKAHLLAGALILAFRSVLGQDTPPDLSRSPVAGRQDFGAWGHVLPALLFFVGLALIAGLFLLGEGSRRRRGAPGPGQPPDFPRRFPRPPLPPQGPKR